MHLGPLQPKMGELLNSLVTNNDLELVVRSNLDECLLYGKPTTAFQQAIDKQTTSLMQRTPQMRLSQINSMWLKDLTVPDDLSFDEIQDFWYINDRPTVERERTVRQIAKIFDLQILIEGGTFQGAMIEATQDIFRKIISIEIGQELVQKAQTKFAAQKHVEILHGDTTAVLPNTLKGIDKPCLFWLDSHYVPNSVFSRGKSDCPLLQELDIILKHKVKDHVILIDDARCFIGPNAVSKDYPSFDQIKNFVNDLRDDLTLYLNPKVADIIFIYPTAQEDLFKEFIPVGDLSNREQYLHEVQQHQLMLGT